MLPGKFLRDTLLFTYLSPVVMSADKLLFKILVISDYRPVSSARPEAEIFIRLAQQGHTIQILSYPEATYYNQRFRDHGIEVIEKHPTRKVSLSYIRYLRVLVRQERHDFVHAFNSLGLTNAVWALGGTSAKLIAYRGYAGQTPWYDPLIYTKYFHPRVDHIICVSRDIEMIMARNMIRPGNKLSTIAKGHDPEWYKDIIPVDKMKEGFHPDQMLVCFLANVRPFKGLPFLIKATHLLPPGLPLQFAFIGHGYDQPEIQKAMDESPYRDQFHVLGYKSDALSYLAASDCLLLTSTHGEGLSKCVVEAMSLGIAPIITDIPGNRGLLVDGESGWMIPARDANAIASALVEMQQDPAERKRRGRMAREHIQRYFHIDQTVEKFLAMYRRL